MNRLARGCRCDHPRAAAERRLALLLGSFTLGLLLAALIAGAPASFAQSDEDLEAQINGTPAGASLELPARDYYVDGTIDVQAHGQHVDANGARFIATAQGYPVFRITGSGLRLEDTTVIGRNQAHKAARPPGADSFQFGNPTSWEWDHGYAVEAASDITLAGVRAYDVWGDGVAVQYAQSDVAVPSRNVHIVPSASRIPEFRHVGRNGVSFVSAVNSSLQGAHIADVHGLWAVDIEPDTAEQDAQGITIAGNRLGSSPWSQVNLNGPWFESGGDGHVFADISVVDNVIPGPPDSDQPSIWIHPNGHRVAGVKVVGNDVVAGRKGIRVSQADGGVVTGNSVCPGAFSSFLGVQLLETTGIAEYGNECRHSSTPGVTPPEAPGVTQQDAPAATPCCGARRGRRCCDAMTKARVRKLCAKLRRTRSHKQRRRLRAKLGAKRCAKARRQVVTRWTSPHRKIGHADRRTRD